ncbi:MAG: OmpA family protein [Akkermansiaceae bacterium]
MAEGYSWNTARSAGIYRLPGPDRLGWWAAVAMFVSILLHVIVFFMLDRMKIAFKFEEAQELVTRPVDVRQIEVRPVESERSLPPEEVVQPPNDAAALLDEIELLDILPEDVEIDIRPSLLEAEYAIQLQNPAMEGSPQAFAEEISSGFEFDSDLPELGREPETIQPAAVGQLTVDPGAIQADDLDLGKFTEDLIRRGADGKVESGTLDGITSLDALLDLPPNILLAAKTMLPSDLLFEFNSSDLRESAKVGLMKLGLLMDRNPSLYCWIEGHTDLVGGDEFNLKLSIQRAEQVKTYLVESLRMDATKIITRGFGRYQPLVISGDPDEQSPNRRVEIRMRKTPPTEAQRQVEPRKAAVIEEVEEVKEAPAPRAVLVRPQRAISVEESEPPRVAPVEEEALPLRATPVEEVSELPAVPLGTPVAPEASRPVYRAQPVE